MKYMHHFQHKKAAFSTAVEKINDFFQKKNSECLDEEKCLIFHSLFGQENI